jgi:hypothetical protein
LGHGVPGHNPDNLGTHKAVWDQYVNDLFDTLGGDRNDSAAMARLQQVLNAGADVVNKTAGINDDTNRFQGALANAEANELAKIAKRDFGHNALWEPAPGGGIRSDMYVNEALLRMTPDPVDEKRLLNEMRKRTR